MPGCAHGKGARGPRREEESDVRELFTLTICSQPLPCTQIMGSREREPPKRGMNPKEVLATIRGKTPPLTVFCLPDPAMDKE